MFQTTTHARHHALSALAGANHDVWTEAALTSPRPWFLATCIAHTDEGALEDTLLLSTVGQVKNLLEQDRSKLELLDLLLVSPGRLNGTAHWKMEPLKEVWQAYDPVSDCDTWVYLLADEERYIDSLLPAANPQLAYIDCVLKLSARSL